MACFFLIFVIQYICTLWETWLSSVVSFVFGLGDNGFSHRIVPFFVHYKEIHGHQYSWHVLISRILSTLTLSLWVSNVYIQLVGWGIRWSSGTPEYTVSHCCMIILHICSRHHHLTAPLIWESESPFHLLSQPLTITMSWKFAIRSFSFPPMHSIPYLSCLW